MALSPGHQFSFRQKVVADVWRCQGGYSAGRLLKAWFQDPALRPVFTLRLVQACAGRGAWWCIPALLARLWHRRTQRRCGVDVPASLSAGPGFKLLHGWGIVINEDAKIGANVTVMQGVTIGGTGRGIPTIEDDVIICANATVVGGLTLGEGCVVGAGCVVTRDVAPHTTVVGNPQREIPRRNPPRIYNHAPLPRHA
ncbi:MAG TPA: serine acetyltransferase [Roseateles sp.]|nr:serine acetyltransferase [Roseateles sp.]